MRFDYWMSVLNDSLWQVTEWRDVPADFNVDLREARLGGLSAMVETISPHRSRRTRADVERSAERSCHLFVSLKSAWSVTHNGRHERLDAGDVVMLGEGEHETHVPYGFQGVIVKCPEHWVQTWLPDPGVIAGRSIRRDAGWGRVLSPMLSQFTPEFASTSSLPHAVLVDQVGAMLALIAGDAETRAMPELRKQIRECIRQRCGEPALTASEVAATLEVAPRRLHKALAADRTTFASELLQARVHSALALLSPAASRGRTIAEIARQAGFVNASHFARVVRHCTGLSPQEFRRAKR